MKSKIKLLLEKLDRQNARAKEVDIAFREAIEERRKKIDPSKFSEKKSFLKVKIFSGSIIVANG